MMSKLDFPCLPLFSCGPATLFNSKALEDKGCDPRFKPSGKLCDPASDMCQLQDGANSLHMT